MIEALIIFEHTSGLSIYEKFFGPSAMAGKVDLFSSFFSAIGSYVQELLKKQDQNLEKMVIGEQILHITTISSLDIQFVTISDAKEEKQVKKFIGALEKELLLHKLEFQNWDGNVSKFKFIDFEVEKLVREYKLIDTSLLPSEAGLSKEEQVINRQRRILDSLWDVSPPQNIIHQETFREEVKDLYEQYKKSSELIRKIDILDAIDHIVQKLNDSKELEQLTIEREKLVKNILDIREKIKYYLTQTKQALNKSIENLHSRPLVDFETQSIYLNLYSFSTKLRIIGHIELANYYKTLAMWLINKPEDFAPKIREKIKEILNISENLCDYLPRPYC